MRSSLRTCPQKKQYIFRRDPADTGRGGPCAAAGGVGLLAELGREPASEDSMLLPERDGLDSYSSESGPSIKRTGGGEKAEFDRRDAGREYEPSLSAHRLCQPSPSRTCCSALSSPSGSCRGTRMSKIDCSESPAGFHPPCTLETGETSIIRPVTRASGINLMVAKDCPAAFWQRMVKSWFTTGATDLFYGSGF